MSNSQKRYGAMPSEWELVKASRLTSRVLPIVSNPELTAVGALTKSNTRGKVPSIKTKTGAVAGMQNWTRHETTPEEIEQWSKDPDNGFCIRTGGDLGIIAIDCDCDNEERAGEIRELFTGMIGAPDIPLRKRGGARWAALLIISDHKPGENISKKIIAMPDGDKVEILADGQQLACCGTHPKGTRYSWSGRPFVDIPEIKGEILDSFIDTISTLYGVENVQTTSAGVRVKGQTFKAMDPVRDFLEERGEVLSYGPNGELFIMCPWCSEHTNESGGRDTAYFPIGSNGYPRGAFKCLHAHCSKRTIDDFKKHLEHMGYEEIPADQYPDETQTEEYPGENRRRETLEKFRNDKGIISYGFTTLRLAMSCPTVIGYELAYDSFTNAKKIRKAIPGAPWEEYTDAKYTVELIVRLEKFGFKMGRIGTGPCFDAMEAVSVRNRFNSLRNYLDLNMPKWDGVKRAERFFADYCGAEQTPYNAAIGRYLFAMLYARATAEKPVKADISIILIGAQGIGKSTAVRALALNDQWCTGVSMRLENKELAQRIQGKTVIEVGEMAGMSKKDIDELKDFLTLDADQWRPVYSRDQVTAIRHCLFIMTTNNSAFLTDYTGNRRFACVDVRKIDIDKIRADILQLWAEGAEIYKADGGEKLHRGIEQYQETENEKHILCDSWEDEILSWIEMQDAAGESGYPITSRNILKYGLGFNAASVKRTDEKRLGAIMEKLGYKLTNSRRNPWKKQQWGWYKDQ